MRIAAVGQTGVGDYKYSLTFSASDCVKPTVVAMSSTAGFADAPQRAELAQQRPLALRADARDGVQRRLHAGLGAHLAVVGDGEAVRLVADALHEVERLRRARQDDGVREVLHEQLLVLLREARQRHVLQPQVAHDVQRRRELPLAAVDDDEVRQGAPAQQSTRRPRHRPCRLSSPSPDGGVRGRCRPAHLDGRCLCETARSSALEVPLRRRT